MIEAARLIRARLVDATNGVNAKLAALALDGGDPTPAAFLDANIVEAATDVRAALDRPDEADSDPAGLFPALLIAVPSVEWLDGEWAQLGERATCRVTVEVRLCLALVDPVAAARETSYRLKALEQCLRAFAHETDMTLRRRNGVELSVLERLQRATLTNPTDDGTVTGGVQSVWYASDANPV